HAVRTGRVEGCCCFYLYNGNEEHFSSRVFTFVCTLLSRFQPRTQSQGPERVQGTRVGAADSALGRDQVSFAESDFCPRAHKSGFRLPVKADAEAWGVGSPSTDGGEHLADF
ncbi:hypothetical protein QTP86_018756, partial [Hemibagrus guttatus]